MKLPSIILEKFILLWKQETGKTLTVNEAISKLSLISHSLSLDKRSHESILKDLRDNNNHNSNETS